MNSFYTVFIFELQNGKYLLCPSDDDCSAQEGLFMYPEAIAFREPRAVTTVKQVESWQIDGLVHLYMHKYGTNNVIGGSYQAFGPEYGRVGKSVSACGISEATCGISEATCGISEATCGISEATCGISESARCYCTSEQIKFITDGLDELNARKEKFRKLGTESLDTIDNYRSQVEMYDNLVQLKDQYHIDRSIIGEIGWLQNLIINGTYTHSDYYRYNTLMQNLAQICQKAISYEIIEKQYYTHNPRLYFDSQAVHKECAGHEVSFEIFEQAIYTLINREDELLYDIEQINIADIRDRLLYQILTTKHHL